MQLSYTDLIGTEFRAGARGPRAFDCWGLVVEVRRRLGLQSPEYLYELDVVENAQAVHTLIAPQTQNPEWCVVDANHIGGVVAIRNSGGPFVNHCGVIVTPFTFIHTLKTVGAHIARVDSPMYRHRIHGIYEWNQK